MSLRSKGKAIKAQISKLRKKMRQQQDLLDKLEFHADLLEYGVDPDEIASFRWWTGAGGHRKGTIIFMRDGTAHKVPMHL